MNKRKEFTKYFWIAPSIIFLLVVIIYPFCRAIYYSFFSFNLSKPADYGKFLGFKNYLDVFKDANFFNSIKILLLIVVIATTIQLFLGFIIALFFQRNEFKFKRALLTILIIPTMLAPIIVGLIWRFLLYTHNGLITYFFNLIGFYKDVSILSIPINAIITIILVDSWEWTPFVILLFIAGMASLPEEPFEAAVIDGSSKFGLVKYITIPLLRPLIVVALLFRFVDALKLFDIVFVLTNGGPAGVTEVANLYMYRIGFIYFNFSYSSTLAVFFIFALVIISIIIYINTVIRSRIERKIKFE
ncbi:MAG: sugar ABC transporter permease [Actinobacteria bacterium]|nr:sugar ABC transporter permease [Actinomycetota bacterium]